MFNAHNDWSWPRDYHVIVCFSGQFFRNLSLEWKGWYQLADLRLPVFRRGLPFFVLFPACHRVFCERLQLGYRKGYFLFTCACHAMVWRRGKIADFCSECWPALCYAKSIRRRFSSSALIPFCARWWRIRSVPICLYDRVLLAFHVCIAQIVERCFFTPIGVFLFGVVAGSWLMPPIFHKISPVPRRAYIHFISIEVLILMGRGWIFNAA